jgi:HAD superfamily hydrolase (TIGR01509 family)
VRTYEAILFDFDGVLVDSEPVHFECWRQVLRPFGIELDWDVYRARFIGISDLAMLEELAKLREPPVDVELLWREYPRKRALFRERMLGGSAITPAVRDLLAGLDGMRLAVVSSSGRDEIEPILTAGGIRPCFGALVCREDVTEYKPAPAPYLKAAELLEVRRALVVEDSAAGIASGRAAGFDVLEVPAASQMPALLLDYLRKCETILA